MVHPDQSPPLRQHLPHAQSIQHRGTGFPVGIFDLAVLFIERVAGGRGAINQLIRGRLVVQRHLHPDIFQGVRDLAEQAVDRILMEKQEELTPKWRQALFA